MDEEDFDYLAEIKKVKKKAKAEGKEVTMSVRFSNETVLSIFLIEARGELWREEEVKKIYEDIEGIKWNTKLTSRFAAYMKNNQMYQHIFGKLCKYLKKDPNDVLNEGKCALIATYGTEIFFDPYSIMPPRNNQKNKSD